MPDAAAPAVKLSKAETIKRESGFLKGNIAAELDDRSNDEVTDETYELLKFHGSYFGYDRDSATERKQKGLDKEYEFMVRMKCPGGRLSAAQYIALDALAEKYANGTLRITTRETFQFHCIKKVGMKPLIGDINALLLSTLGGCGDVVRNIMTCPAPIHDAIHARLEKDCFALASHCAPKTSSYYEIWTGGEQIASYPFNPTPPLSSPPLAGGIAVGKYSPPPQAGGAEGEKYSSTPPGLSLSPPLAGGTEGGQGDVEPLYGATYMPRKFKIGIATPEDNCIDALSHDLGILSLFNGQEHYGYNFALGGGMGMKHNSPKTYPRLASPIMFVPPELFIPATEAVIKLQRDFGDRGDRQHARLKYVIQERGIAWAKQTLEAYLGRAMDDPRPMPAFAVEDHTGWHEQGNGKWFLGLPIMSGRIEDREGAAIRTGLREVIMDYGMDLRLTADQNILLCDIETSEKPAIEARLRTYGIALREDLTPASRTVLACVAYPTCGKALAEAERVALPLMEGIEKVMEKHGVKDDAIAIRIAGCPNGCSRPYGGDIGIVGRMPDHYALFIGGDYEGTRLNEKVFDKVPYEALPQALDPMLALWKAQRRPGEGFGNFCRRVGVATVKQTAVAALTGRDWAQ